jgi:hypothetical protein
MAVFVSWFSIRFKHAAAEPIFRELVDEPITFGRVLAVAVSPARYRHASNACLNNLRQIDAVTQRWALDHNKRAGDKVTWNDLAPYLDHGYGRRPWCPAGGVYLITCPSNAPTCSIPNHRLL